MLAASFHLRLEWMDRVVKEAVGGTHIIFYSSLVLSRIAAAILTFVSGQSVKYTKQEILSVIWYLMSPW